MVLNNKGRIQTEERWCPPQDNSTIVLIAATIVALRHGARTFYEGGLWCKRMIEHRSTQ